MNIEFIAKLENKIKYLELEYQEVEKFVPQEGYEIISDNIKYSYISELSSIISNLQRQLENAKSDDNIFVKLMMDNVFDDGVPMSGRDGGEYLFSLPTKMEMTFENNIHLAMQIVDKHKLIQCRTPRTLIFDFELDNKLMKHKVIELTDQLFTGNATKDFDIFEVFSNNLELFDSEMNKMKYIYNVAPVHIKDIGINLKGIKIKCHD